MSEPRKHLIAWLHDAYAMEQKAIEILSHQAGRIENYPQLEKRIKQHLQETRWQAEQLESCLTGLGEDVGVMKAGLGKIAGNLVAMGTMFADDEIVKDTMAGAVFEHMEIAAYKVIIAAAEQIGETRVMNICSEILAQEEAMAEWLDDHIPDTTTTFLTRDNAGMEAKI